MPLYIKHTYQPVSLNRVVASSLGLPTTIDQRTIRIRLEQAYVEQGTSQYKPIHKSIDKV